VALKNFLRMEGGQEDLLKISGPHPFMKPFRMTPLSTFVSDSTFKCGSILRNRRHDTDASLILHAQNLQFFRLDFDPLMMQVDRIFRLEYKCIGNCIVFQVRRWWG
jgi:hypothetical protein